MLMIDSVIDFSRDTDNAEVDNESEDVRCIGDSGELIVLVVVLEECGCIEIVVLIFSGLERSVGNVN